MSKEAMKLALEALEDANDVARMEFSDENYYSEAINALRQALVDADDTSQKCVDEMVKTEHDRAVELGQAYERGWNAALAQQEPVAWITDGGKGELWWYQSSKFDEEGNLIGPNPDDIPLYTAPPKREWVGLTAYEIQEIHSGNQHWGNFACAIEAKLREKNHG